MSEETLPQRTIRTTFWVSLWFVFLFALRGQLPVCFGLAIGTAIGLFSLWTLTWAIPRLVRGGDPAGKFWLGLLTFAKLPIYAVTLNFAMVSPLVSPLAVFCGVAMIPAVIVLKTLGGQMMVKAQTPRQVSEGE